jgi:hypothetical protein
MLLPATTPPPTARLPVAPRSVTALASADGVSPPSLSERVAGAGGAVVIAATTACAAGGAGADVASGTVDNLTTEGGATCAAPVADRTDAIDVERAAGATAKE